jgi:hypothetical protein
MNYWDENRNGNYVTENDEGKTITVFRCKDDLYRGICDEEITDDGYLTPEEAMEAIDSDTAVFTKMRARSTWWKANKNGGYSRKNDGVLLSVKQSRSGSWYCTIGTRLQEGQWFETHEEARCYVDSLCGGIG